MKKIVHVVAALGILALLAAPPADAQSSAPPGQPARDNTGAGTLPSPAGVQAADPQEVEQAFGPDLQWTSVFASHFVPISSGTLPPNTDDYPYVCVNPGDTGPLSQYWAQLDLPNGAEITYLYAMVKDSATDSQWRFWLIGYESAYAGESPYYVDHETAATDIADTPGYVSIPLIVDPPVVVREHQDLDGDGFYHLTATGLALRADPIPADSSQMCFFGAGVKWSRTVSPAPASATFADVPTGHWAFRFVEALVDSGITAGCGGGNYCPDDPVTRAQMAVYLAAALGLHWPE